MPLGPIAIVTGTGIMKGTIIGTVFVEEAVPAEGRRVEEEDAAACVNAGKDEADVGAAVAAGAATPPPAADAARAGNNPATGAAAVTAAVDAPVGCACFCVC